MEQPKFEFNNPSNKEEKLIVELIKNLDDVTYAFIKLNHSGNITHEMFVILRDASIGYAGAMIRDLAKILSNKEQIISFIQEAKIIYMAYMDELMLMLLSKGKQNGTI